MTGTAVATGAAVATAAVGSSVSAGAATDSSTAGSAGADEADSDSVSTALSAAAVASTAVSTEVEGASGAVVVTVARSSGAATSMLTWAADPLQAAAVSANRQMAAIRPGKVATDFTDAAYCRTHGGFRQGILRTSKTVSRGQPAGPVSGPADRFPGSVSTADQPPVGPDGSLFSLRHTLATAKAGVVLPRRHRFDIHQRPVVPYEAFTDFREYYPATANTARDHSGRATYHRSARSGGDPSCCAPSDRRAGSSRPDRYQSRRTGTRTLGVRPSRLMEIGTSQSHHCGS